MWSMTMHHNKNAKAGRVELKYSTEELAQYLFVLK